MAIPFVRIINIPVGGKLVPTFAEYGYTYQDMWYFCWSRILEFMFYFCLYKHTKHLIFVFVSTLALMKIIDEPYIPFGFKVSELFSWFIASIVTYVVYSRRMRQSSGA